MKFSLIEINSSHLPSSVCICLVLRGFVCLWHHLVQNAGCEREKPVAFNRIREMRMKRHTHECLNKHHSWSNSYKRGFTQDEVKNDDLNCVLQSRTQCRHTRTLQKNLYVSTCLWEAKLHRFQDFRKYILNEAYIFFYFKMFFRVEIN